MVILSYLLPLTSVVCNLWHEHVLCLHRLVLIHDTNQTYSCKHCGIPLRVVKSILAINNKMLPSLLNLFCCVQVLIGALESSGDIVSLSCCDNEIFILKGDRDIIRLSNSPEGLSSNCKYLNDDYLLLLILLLPPLPKVL